MNAHIKYFQARHVDSCPEDTQYSSFILFYFHSSSQIFFFIYLFYIYLEKEKERKKKKLVRDQGSSSRRHDFSLILDWTKDPLGCSLGTLSVFFWIKKICVNGWFLFSDGVRAGLERETVPIYFTYVSNHVMRVRGTLYACVEFVEKLTSSRY